MNLLDHKYTAGQVAELSGVSGDTLRDWRRRDILKEFGKIQGNGRWLYSGNEILMIAIARAMELNGQTILYGLWMAHHCLVSVIKKIYESHHPNYAEENEYSGLAKDYVLFWLDKAGSPWIRVQGWELQHLPTNDLADIAKAGAPSVIVVDIEHLAKSLKPALINSILHGIAEPGKDGIYVSGESD